MATVLLAGASGLIGNALVTRLSKSHTIHILTRNKSLDSQINSFYWNPQTGEIDANAFNNVSCVINLSGKNISNSRWSKKQKVKN